MTATFERCLSIVLNYEGNDAISYDPRDSGGLTRWGISQVAHPGVDVRHLTRDLAAQIYLTAYWRPLRCDDLPPQVALCTFDAGVNQGVETAARMLQAVVGAQIDGVIGTKTLIAVHKRPVARTVRDFMTARLHRYSALGGWHTYGKGWGARVIGITVESMQWDV